MIYLLLSIISSSAIFLLFKIFSLKKVDTLKAITVNYFTAFLLGVFLMRNDLEQVEILDNPIVQVGCGLGFLFIGLFFLMAKISQDYGAGISSTATKLSLVLSSVYFMITSTSEDFSVLKLLGLVMAIPGIILLIGKDKENGYGNLVLPLILFIGSGILDIVLATAELNFVQTEIDATILTITPFLISGIIGFIILVTKSPIIDIFTRKELLFGLILGIINFASIYFLILCYQNISLAKSSIIPINNLCIVILSAISAFIVLKEKLKHQNLYGLLICICSILFILFS